MSGFLERKADVVEELLEKAELQGYLTMDDVIEMLPNPEERVDEVEEVFVRLVEAGIEVCDAEDGVQESKTSVEIAEEVEIEKAAFDLSAISTDDSVGLYLKEMARVPLLSFEEEVGLAKTLCRGRDARRDLERMENGQVKFDAEEREHLEQSIEEARLAREHLIEANTRLVVSVAKKYLGRGVPFLDLIQEGNLGLMRAVEKFDYTRGYRLSTYATWWIRQTITRAVADQGRTIRVPVHMGDQISRLYKTAHRLEQECGRRPTPEEIAQEMGLKPRKVRWILKVSRYPLSLERLVGEEEDSELGSFIEDDSIPPPDQSAHQHLLCDKVEEVLNTLTPREARILRLRFGLQDGRSYTLEEVGQKFGLTRERIRQLESRALRRLRHPRRSRQLRDYLP
jgi:RNA polymerase primary sigma factor